jgi:RimJ/RimL family protein N-acetyltransferase
VNVEPLWHLRIRTPRLELRLPTDDELLELYHLAEAGIHPPEEMPFAEPWTDDLREDSFVAYHRSRWSEWQPDDWTLNLVTFCNGQVIGTQGILAERFAASRTVSTGSWLGARSQRRGFGTEQRAAILEFAFRGLGAEVAVSGALVHNVASQRISEKLGYTRTGISELAPRGEPVPHLDYRLDRQTWRCPLEVELEGVAAARELFGV